MAREPREHAEQPEQQPKRPFEWVRDYLKLLRFRMDFGSQHNAHVFWAEHGGTRNPPPPPRGDTGGVTGGRR